jgi:hypothetical protein
LSGRIYFSFLQESQSGAGYATGNSYVTGRLLAARRRGRFGAQRMNPAHLHIILNHIPVIGIPIGAALLLSGVLRRSEEVKHASLLIFVVVALIAIPTFLSGKAAEDVVEHLPGVSERVIETHEEAATVGLVVISILGLLSLIGLAWSIIRGALGSVLALGLLAVALGASGWLGRVANLGGKIRHTEFSAQATAGNESALIEDAEEAEDAAETVRAPEENVRAPEERGRRGRGRGRGRGGRDR